MSSGIITKTWPFLAIILAHSIWGVNFIVAKLTLQEIPPMSLAFLRFAIASILLSPFIFTTEEKIKIDKKDLPQLFGIGLLMVTLNIALFYAGLERTTISSASVLTLTVPVASVVAGWWILKEKIYMVNLAGIALGVLGALVILGTPLLSLDPKPSSEALLGNLLIVLASLAWVAGAIISKEMHKKYSTLTITAVIFLIGVITFLIPAIIEYLQNPAWVTQVTTLGILGLVFIALASSVSAYFLFEWGLNKVGVVTADLFQYLEPMIAGFLGVLVLREELKIPLVFGTILIGIGAYLSTLIKTSHKHHKAHRH